MTRERTLDRTEEDNKLMRTVEQTVEDGPNKSRDEAEQQQPPTITTTKTTTKPITKRGRPKDKSKERDATTCMAFVNNTLNRGVESILAEFRDAKRGNDYTKMKVFQEYNKEGRNRYKDVGCLDETRVKLTLGPIPYIHANYVAGYNNPKRFICTQAPVNKTIADFWYMIVQEKSSVIVMLCNHREKGCNKCAHYFPTSLTKALIVNEEIIVTALEIGDLKIVESVFANPKGKPTVITRTRLCVRIKGHKEFKVQHLHWKDWPDRGVPEIDFAAISLCDRFYRGSQKPVTIHCSAGIGRTGSIVLINLMYEHHLAGIAWKPTLAKYLQELRNQRNNSVQTEQQYLFVHAVMLGYVLGYLGVGVEMQHFCSEMRQKKPEEKTDEEKKKETNYLDLLHKFSTFSENYKKSCDGFS